MRPSWLTLGLGVALAASLPVHHSPVTLTSGALTTPPSPILRTVPVGAWPSAIAVDASTRRAFVVNARDASVSVLDAQSGAVLRTVALAPADRPFTYAGIIGVDAPAGHVFVDARDETGQGYVSMLDARTGARLRTVRVGLQPFGLAVDAATARVFVANGQSGTISILDSHSGAVVATTPVEGRPTWLVAAPGATRILVNATGTPHLALLDARTGARVARALGGAGIGAVAVDERAGRVITDDSAGVLRLLDARTGAVRATRRGGVDALTSSIYPDNVDMRLGRAYLAGPPPGKDSDQSPAGSRITGALLAVDTRTGTVVGRVSVTPHPNMIVVDAVHGHILTVVIGPIDSAGNPLGSGQLDIRDERTLRLVRTVRMGVAPYVLAVAPSLGRVYVVNAAISFDPSSYGSAPTVAGHTLTHGTVTVLDLARL